MKDDFEYHINLPTADISHGFDKEPVIVLFGWAGCADRHLSKYSQVYEKQGCITIRFVTSPTIMSPTVVNQQKILSVAEEVVSLLLDMGFNEHPIFFHLFSNGGCAVYRYVTQILQKAEHQGEFQIKGCVFDSCPANVSATGLMRAAMAVTQGGIIWKYCVAIYILIQAIFLEFCNSFSSMFSNQYTRKRLWMTLLEEPNICPQLFLFSKADNICDWKSIQLFADKRKEKGVDVSTILWDDSPHVQHMLVHEEAYCSAMLTFVNEQIRDPIPEMLK